MKHWFDEAFYRRSAAQLAALHASFDAPRFLAHALDGLDRRELMARLHRTANAFHLALPLPFAGQLAVLRAHAPQIGHNFVAIWPCAHIARHGLARPDLALPALRELTRHGSAEFAIRPFLVHDLEGTLAAMRAWADDAADEHARRLASEGCRPRLPWGERLHALVADPRPALPILETLRADPSLYVRKSVANHLNDISKDHPELVLDVASAWNRRDARTAWIVKHALRTLIKKGHPRALALLGAGDAPKVKATLAVSPRRLRLGESVAFTAKLHSTSTKRQSLIVDYVVHYVRDSGRASAKVFKWTALELAPGESVSLTKRQTIRDFTTRRHHAGRHRVELQINGRRLAETAFSLMV